MCNKKCIWIIWPKTNFKKKVHFRRRCLNARDQQENIEWQKKHIHKHTIRVSEPNNEHDDDNKTKVDQRLRRQRKKNWKQYISRGGSGGGGSRSNNKLKLEENII